MLIAGAAQAEESACLDLTTLPPSRYSLGTETAIVAPDGQRFATLPSKRPSDRPVPLIFHDLPSRRETGRLLLSGPSSASFSPDSRWIAAQVVGNEGASPTSTGRWIQEVALIDPATARLAAKFRIPGQSWGNFAWTFSPDGKSLAVTYRTEQRTPGPGDPDPGDEPVTVEDWDISSR